MRRCNRGYFQFEAKTDGLYVTVYPPLNGDKPVAVSDIMYYIDKKKLPDCDLVRLNQIVREGFTNETTGLVSQASVFPVAEFGDYRLTSDCMTLEAVFYPPFAGAPELSTEEIIRDIKSLGVKIGIDEERIKAFIEDRRYFETYVVAVGKKPRDGYEGYVEYKFNTELKPTPKMNDDGTVDFHTLENVNHVKQGDVVAVLHPEDRGEAGMDLLGRMVSPKKVGHVIFRHGANLYISEDGRELISKVSGHITFENDKIFVSNVLELVNVDASTGDIKYEGDVNIKGNVLAGFSVEAAGNISVSGVVEGSTVIAGGDITLNRGIQGMNKAVISAGGNIVTKFIESAKQVSAGGYIETDSILHSKVTAKGPIVASGRNGLIVGGDVRSIVLVEARNIGNDMGTATIVGVGVDPAARRRVDELKMILQKSGDNKIKLSQMLDALRKKQMAEGSLEPDKIELQQKTMRNLLLLEKELSAYKAELEELRGQLGEDDSARVKVKGSIHIGTKLVFGDQSYFIKEKQGFCQFLKERADIKWYTL